MQNGDSASSAVAPPASVEEPLLVDALPVMFRSFSRNINNNTPFHIFSLDRLLPSREKKMQLDPA
jgi:hypothetical protein